ncbi:MAG TPA: hypothetical protein VNC42_04780, partial [Bradyrhizobium sp.]|nr:hypothetical protein [Bradyrhizobium sp.]
MSADQPIGAGRNRLEYRLHVRRRAGDHLQDVGRGGLPLQRLPGLVEQPGVLNRNHRLVGEGLQQRQFLVAERTFEPRDADRADAALVPHHRRVGHRLVSG